MFKIVLDKTKGVLLNVMLITLFYIHFVYYGSSVSLLNLIGGGGF